MIDHTLWLPYTQMQTTRPPLHIAETINEYLITPNGDKIIDAIGSWWTACHGYRPQSVIAAMKAQIDTLPHVMLGGIVHPQAKRLAHRLAQILPGDLNHVFLANTGSEAVEIALKMAIQFWLNQGENRSQFMSFYDGYHGDTLYAMSVCDPQEGMHHLFQATLPKQAHQKIPCSDEDWIQLEQWLAKTHQNIAGMIIEPLVQGAGGMKMHSRATLKRLYSLAKKYNLLFIADEIFTGFGRTGQLFAVEHAQVVPDIICLSKALTAGTTPLAAVVTTSTVYNQFLSEDPDKALMHGPTFMGHAIGCAAANANLDLFAKNEWQSQVKQIEQHLIETLEPLAKWQHVKAVRVLGAIGVVQLQSDLSKHQNKLVDKFIADGIWLRPFRDIIYTTPSFNISPDSLAQITHAIGKQTAYLGKYF